MSGTFRLTPGIVAAFAGSQVVCLAPAAIGQTFRLYAKRPGAHMNRAIRAGGVVVEPNGEVEGGEGDENADAPIAVTRVDISGVIEQRAGYHSECGGWSDGHDAIAERMIAALEQSDVLLVIDSPGGAHAGLEQAVARVMREKEEHGRTVTVYADEMISSAAYWWAACVGDKICAPPSAVVGSIGARAAHASEAGALAKAGVEITFFAWPGDGKVAFAGELPLSDLGKQRGMRDTSIAGEAFAAAVGPRRGLTRENIVELDADALGGQPALDAGLIDEVASYEDVLQYCIALAETSGDQEMTQATAATTTDSTIAPSLRTEKEPEGLPPGKEPDHVCKNCGHQQEPDSKYCDQCSNSMEAPPLEDPDKDPDGDGDKSAAADPKPAAAFPEKKEARGETVASLLGLRKGASDLAIKTAIIRKLQVVDFVTALTGVSDEAEMLGQLRAMSEDAAASGQLRRSVNEMRAKGEAAERIDLLKKLAAAGLPDYPRGNLLIDEVAANGRVTALKPAPAYAEMKLGTLRGIVNAKIANAAPAVERSPYVAQPDPAQAAAAVESVRLEAAKQNPVVQKAARDGIPLETAAAIYAREFGSK